MSEDSDIEFSDDETFLEKRRQELMQQQQQAPAANVEESDDAIFRSHFDKSSTTYHHGSKVVVPMGGQRVPDSMKDHANWQELPEVEQQEIRPDQFGSTYETLHYKREAVNNLKKAIASVLPSVAALVQNKLALKSATEDQIVKAQDKVTKAEGLRKVQLDNLKTYVDKHNESKSEYAVDLNKVYNLAAADVTSVEEHQHVIEQSKRLTQRLFLAQNALLQEMKQAKAAYLKNKA